jgi:hypothetical protein
VKYMATGVTAPPTGEDQGGCRLGMAARPPARLSATLASRRDATRAATGQWHAPW